MIDDIEEEDYFFEPTKAERREKRKRNNTKMKVDGIGLRIVWAKIISEAEKIRKERLKSNGQ